jgi:hypothetical protein
MPTKLRKLKISAVAVCPQGANYDLDTGAGAHILLFKSAEPDDGAFDKAERTAAATNDLPDDAFAYVENGGKKDGEGKTTPRSLRHLPYKTASGAIDKPHLRNALARLDQTHIPASAKASAKRKLQAAARSVGIEVGKFDEPMGMHAEPDGDEETPLDYASRGKHYDLWESLWEKWQCFCETYYDITADNDEDNIPNLPILVRSIAQFEADVSSLLLDLDLVDKVAPAVAAIASVAKAGAPMAGHRLTRLRDAIAALQQILDECTPVMPEHAGVSAAEVVPASGYGTSHIPYLMKGARAMAVATRKNAESDKEHCDNCDDKDCTNGAHDRMKNMNKQDAGRIADLEASLEAVTADLVKAKTDLAIAQSEAAGLREEQRLAKMSPEEQEATWLASLPEAVRKRYEADAVEKVELRKKLQEADERAERADYIQKTAAFRGIGFVPDKHWSILKALDAIPDEDTRSEVYRLLSAANEQLRTSKLFSANGTSGHPTGAGQDTGSASDQLMAMTKAYQDEKGVDFTKASEAVAKAHPDLYTRMIQERRRQSRVSSE